MRVKATEGRSEDPIATDWAHILKSYWDSGVVNLPEFNMSEFEYSRMGTIGHNGSVGGINILTGDMSAKKHTWSKIAARVKYEDKWYLLW